jgi:hypothetical protein
VVHPATMQLGELSQFGDKRIFRLAPQLPIILRRRLHQLSEEPVAVVRTVINKCRRCNAVDQPNCNGLDRRGGSEMGHLALLSAPGSALEFVERE